MEKITKPSDTVLIDPNEPLILPDGTALVGRVEWFLYALCCLDYQNLPTPMSRIEEFANALITGEIPNVEPQSRAEQFFLAILDGNVSNLPKPQSRSEVLLDKLARGEFDLSDVEPIQSRYELLLAYLIKNGGIGNIDYVLYEFSEAMKTMYNTVEKPFKSLELSGNTLVNCVLEDTENDDYTSFDKDYNGTSFTINGTSEGAIKSAILKGNTLVNLFDINTNANLPNTDGVYTEWITFKNNGNVSCYQGYYNSVKREISVGEKLIAILYVDKNTIGDVTVHSPHTGYYLSPMTFGTITSSGVFKSNPFTMNFAEGKTKDEVINFRCITSSPTIGEFKFRMVILEYQDGMENWDIPYFEGMQSVKMPVLTTTGKNLFNPNAEFNMTDGLYGFIKLTNNKNNSISVVEKDSTVDMSNIYFGLTPRGIDATGGCHWLHSAGNLHKTKIENSPYGYFSFFPNNKTTLNKILQRYDIQFEEGTTATSYEPFKTNILTVNEPVELRGIGDVQDTLDLLTGKIVSNFATYTFNGSENFIDNKTSDSHVCFGFNVLNIPTLDSSKSIGLSKDIPYQNWSGGYPDKELIYVKWAMVYVSVSKDKLVSHDVNGLKTFLKERYETGNPISFIYPLSEKSIKTVALNVVDQNNTKIDKIHVFNEVTHVNTSSDELTPTVNIGKSVSYPTIIKPNTKYTVDLKRNDKPLTVNLGGTEVAFASGETRKTITTPSTLTNDKLSCYGIGAKCNEIMLIEGEVEGNVDYFTGMQSVVMPVLTTTGKNLFSFDNIDINNALVTKKNSSSVQLNGSGRFDYFYINLKLEPNTTYTFGYTFYKEVGEIANGGERTCQIEGATVSNIRIFYYPTDNNKPKSVAFTTNSTGEVAIRLYGTNDAQTYKTNFNDVYINKGNIGGFEPYKTSILSCNDEIELNGIETYKDVLDCNNKKITRRTRKLLLNGSDDVQWNTYALKDEFPNVIGFYYTFPKEVERYGNKYLYNGSLPPTERDVFPGNITSNEEVIVVNNNGYIKLSIYRNKLKSLNADGLKEWLSENPIELTYVLKNPIVSEVELSVIDQDGNTIPKIKSYNNVTHLEVTIPKQSLLPHISAEVATDNSKDMSSLTTKHREISEAQSTIEDNIQSQSDEIDTALMATTEIFESILE